MNILFFIGVYPDFGGTERVTTVLANAFVKRGENVNIVSFRQPKGRDLDIGLSDKVKVHYLRMPVWRRDNCREFRKILIENNVNVIFNQWCWPFYTARFINKARKGLGITLLAINHGVPDQCHVLIVAREAYYKARRLAKLYAGLKYYIVSKIVLASIRYVYKVSDAYVVLSNGFLNVFKRYTGIHDANKLTWMPNPITIQTDYTTTYFTSKKKQILYVGRMDKVSKRVDRILDVWDEVSKKFLDWEMVFVGGGPHLNELRPAVECRKIPRVTFTGFVQEDPIEYYRNSKIFMMTSDLEGFGLVIIEAMSYGVVPVVYGSYVSVYEIIDNGIDGYITSMPYSHKATVEYITKLIENEELCNQMALLAQEKSKKFALDFTVDRWYQLISAVRNRKVSKICR